MPSFESWTGRLSPSHFCGSASTAARFCSKSARVSGAVLGAVVCSVLDREDWYFIPPKKAAAATPMNSRNTKKRRKARPAPFRPFADTLATLAEVVCAESGPGQAIREGGVKCDSVLDGAVVSDKSGVRSASDAVYFGSPTSTITAVRLS